MNTSPLKEALLLANSTSGVGLATSLYTSPKTFTIPRVFHLIDEIKEVSYEMIDKQPIIQKYPATELCKDRIEINNDDFVKFKNHLKSDKIIENPKLMRLLEEFSE